MESGSGILAVFLRIIDITARGTKKLDDQGG